MVDVDSLVRQLKQKAASLGLPFGDRKMTFNSRLAQELGLWAETRGRGHRFHDLAFRAYFADGRNIAETEVLLDIAGRAGLDREEAAGVLKNRTFRKAVDADWAQAGRLDIRAVPTFIVGSRRLVGAQPYEALCRLLAEDGKSTRPLVDPQ